MREVIPSSIFLRQVSAVLPSNMRRRYGFQFLKIFKGPDIAFRIELGKVVSAEEASAKPQMRE
jgi:hypothetical protein